MKNFTISKDLINKSIQLIKDESSRVLALLAALMVVFMVGSIGVLSISDAVKSKFDEPVVQAPPPVLVNLDLFDKLSKRVSASSENQDIHIEVPDPFGAPKIIEAE